MQKLLSLSLLILSSFFVFGQASYDENSVTIKKSHVFEPQKAQADFNARLLNMEAPSPDGDDYKAFLMRQKIKSSKLFPRSVNPNSPKQKSNTAQPVVGQGFSKFSTLVNGAVINYSGGIPNDNALAVSNGGIVLSGVNSVIWAYDLNIDTTIFTKHVLSLRSVGNGSNSSNYFDPKLIYDPDADRFILVFLRDNTPATSAFIICFSSTNDPRDEWYVYEIPGNPLNNNRWTDFPCVSITKDEVFLTGNLIIPNVSWQVGFDGSVIWQINKNDGYTNQDSIRNKLFSNIRFDGKYTRNLHAVRGIDNISSRQYFLSNRNFDVTNDTMFVMEVTGTLENSMLHITMDKTSPNYGVPPNGRQFDTDLNDPTKGLQTNDGRVLGAITNGDDWIQYVSTTVNPATGLAGIYHGTILNPRTANQTISGNIISDPVKDYGYPNIAWTGNEGCDVETIIGFNFASPTDFPGVAAVYADNFGSYSDVITLKEGLNFADAHSDSYERWGDYFGIQPKFNEPGTIWTSGYFGLTNNQNGTWLQELSTPDDDILTIQTVRSGDEIFCNGTFGILASGGIPPYQYSFNGKSFSDSASIDSICDGDTIVYAVNDSRGCLVTDTLINPKRSNNVDGTYPNPFSSHLITQFQLKQDKVVSAFIYDIKGSLVAKILEQNATAGLNKLYFDLSPLNAGFYVLKVVSGEDEIVVNKIFKRE